MRFLALRLGLQQLLEEPVQHLPPLVIMLAFMPGPMPKPEPEPMLQLLPVLMPERVPMPKHHLVLDLTRQRPELLGQQLVHHQQLDLQPPNFCFT